MRNWHLAAVICGFASQLLLLIALGSDYWVDAGDINAGLWKACIRSSFGTICGPSDTGAGVSYILATRAFLILGMLAGFFSCALLIFLFFRGEIGSYSVPWIASISSYFAGLLALVAMAVFTGKMGSNSFYGWSFGLGWACGPLFLVTGGVAHKLNSVLSLERLSRLTPARAVLKMCDTGLGPNIFVPERQIDCESKRMDLNLELDGLIVFLPPPPLWKQLLLKSGIQQVLTSLTGSSWKRRL